MQDKIPVTRVKESCFLSGVSVLKVGYIHQPPPPIYLLFSKDTICSLNSIPALLCCWYHSNKFQPWLCLYCYFKHIINMQDHTNLKTVNFQTLYNCRVLTSSFIWHLIQDTLQLLFMLWCTSRTKILTSSLLLQPNPKNNNNNDWMMIFFPLVTKNHNNSTCHTQILELR